MSRTRRVPPLPVTSSTSRDERRAVPGDDDRDLAVAGRLRPVGGSDDARARAAPAYRRRGARRPARPGPEQIGLDASGRTVAGVRGRASAAAAQMPTFVPTGVSSTIWSRYSDSPAPCRSPWRHRVMPSVMRVTMPSRRLRSGMFDHTSPSTS